MQLNAFLSAHHHEAIEAKKLKKSTRPRSDARSAALDFF
jgi:hypothetical protein